MAYIYKSIFKDEIEKYLKYISNQQLALAPHKIYLKSFDTYVLEHNCSKELTRELVDNFLNKNKTKDSNYCHQEVYVIKKFAKFLNIIGIKAYILDSKDYPCIKTFTPHIYTKDEIQKIINCIDIIKDTTDYPHNRLQMKLGIKMLYCCGMRDSELLNLKFQDINFEEKTIRINCSKNNISRLLYINDSLIEDIKKYREIIPNKLENDYIFTNNQNQKYPAYNLERNFRKVISKLNYNGYRLHDFRHTFAVNNLNNWFLAGKDITLLLPSLMTYMGHVSIKSTEYYLRFIPEVYKDMLKMYENKFKDIIPKLNGDFYE